MAEPATMRNYNSIHKTISKIVNAETAWGVFELAVAHSEHERQCLRYEFGALRQRSHGLPNWVYHCGACMPTRSPELPES